MPIPCEARDRQLRFQVDSVANTLL
eukprot:gene26307-biopygen15742